MSTKALQLFESLSKILCVEPGEDDELEENIGVAKDEGTFSLKSKNTRGF